MENRMVTQEERSEDQDFEQTLRPLTFAEYIGQDIIKSNLQIALTAARQRGEAPDHVLIHGAPGLGKTTLAAILAHEMRTNLRVTSGPAIERAGDLAAILTNLETGDVLFIDEIHRLGHAVEEVLYPAMEDGFLDLVVGKGPAARSVRLDLPHFTLVGATTKAGAISSPLRDRFGHVYSLAFYSDGEMAAIVARSARILGIELERDAVEEIGRRARKTPRIANRLLKRVRDFVQVRGVPKVTRSLAEEALAQLEIDRLGLDQTDRKILSAIHHLFNGGPVGVETMAAATGEDRETIETVYEPYLMQIGFLQRTPKGRTVTQAAIDHLGAARLAGASQ